MLEDEIHVAEGRLREGVLLCAVAGELEGLFATVIDQENHLGLAYRDAKPEADVCFVIETPHGEIGATVEHSLIDEGLVGNLRFWKLIDGEVPDRAAGEVWSFVFDSNYRATRDPSRQFAWHFNGSGPLPTRGVYQMLLLIIAKYQAKMRTF
ncbi:hypothetical protein GIY62_06570 [Burkholderia plantarii]|uniref:hypothetical protein n=1 Tax=Burkholderia plantarii TaxID=41899 RepID=UPI00272D8857|nr:hypothetical protein [Burkholderia plantarii]WLE60313.1 hypothetical protein GIY62_06570 [Burkholderia plantarii]